MSAGVGLGAAVLLVVLALWPPVSAIWIAEDGAQIAFAMQPITVASLDQCVTVTWQVEGIREVYLNDAPQIGQGEAQQCAPVTAPAVLRVVLQTGEVRTLQLTAQPDPLRSTRFWLLISAAFVIGIAGVWLSGLHAPRLNASARTIMNGVVRFATPSRILVALCILGSLLRAGEYLRNRPLWADEAVLSLNVIERDYAGLLRPLDYDQGAPLGYLWLLRLMIDVFGVQETALRLPSLIASVGSVVLAAALARRVNDRWAVPLAVWWIATAALPIFYASEVKQYALDEFAALAILLITLELVTRTPTRRTLLFTTMGGAFLLTFSQPAVFAAAAAGVTVLATGQRAGLRVVVRRLIPVAVWGAAFIGLYWFSYRALSGNAYLNTFWDQGFAPYQAQAFLPWLWGRLTDALPSVAGLNTLGLAAPLAFTAGLGLWSQRGERAGIVLIVLPILLCLAAACVRVYPFEGRLILFLAPFFIIGAAEGAAGLFSRLSVSFGVKTVLWALILLPPLILSPRIDALAPDIRPAIRALHAQGAESVYLFGGTSATYRFYAHQYDFTPGRVIDSRVDHLLEGRYTFTPGETVWLFRRGDDSPEDWARTLDYFGQFGQGTTLFQDAGGTLIAFTIE
ncbi:MAG: glycosyltransferase family 39 protein [bacterium]|nr:glycosyltransferase family 39 protein [bacterium]